MTLKEYIKKLEQEKQQTKEAWQNTWAGSVYSEQLWGKLKTLDQIIKELKEIEV